MSISSVACPLCLCLINVLAVTAAPFMSVDVKQSTGLLKNTNETKIVTNFNNLIEFNRSSGNHTADASLSHEVVDMWSVMWYLGAFGGLVTFFLIVTCSEWCFGNHMYTRHGINELYINAYQGNFAQQRVLETPPPPYELFAPPSYSDLFGKEQDTKKKKRINIFIIPIHKRLSSAPAS